MSSDELEMFEPVALAYSAPPLGSPPYPEVFYNPFPDLNDKAPDGSYSAFPKRAKYLFPLDVIFNPYIHDLITSPVLFYDGSKPLGREFTATIHENFEVVHNRLAATEAKSSLRISGLSPLYTALYHSLSSNQTIRVPLVINQNGSKLQRIWAAMYNAFKATLLQDEAISLLATVATIVDPTLRLQLETFWVRGEEEEFKEGFADFYYRVREDQCRVLGSLESCNTEVEVRTWAENFMQICIAIYSFSVLHEGKIFKDLINLITRERVNFLYDTLTNPLPPTNEIEALQQLLAFNFIEENKQQKSFVSPEPMPLYFACDIPTDFSYLRVLPTNRLINLICTHLAGSDGKPIQEAEAHGLTMDMIFLEAMRQQICQGVGLRCPFWQGECCGYANIKNYLEHIYKITKPRLRRWEKHWQKPPCMV